MVMNIQLWNKFHLIPLLLLSIYYFCKLYNKNALDYVEHNVRSCKLRNYCFFVLKVTLINKQINKNKPVAAKVCVVNGSSLITVLRPIDEISLNCSLSPIMLLHNVSTINSTWWSFTLHTNGPKLKNWNMYNMFVQTESKV